MENNLIKIMTDLQNKTFKVVRLTKTKFELDNGDVYPIPFELDLDEEISIEEFEKLLNTSKTFITKLIEDNG